jgi:hypothetical protein
MQYRPTPSTIIQELRRILAAGLIIGLGRERKMFDPAAMAASLDSILASLKKLPLRGIVLMGPFSAPDPVRRYFRQNAVPIFEAAANKHGCRFVDVFSVLESYPKGKAFRSNFADAQHLSVLGHQRVGGLVGAALAELLGQSIAAECDQSKAWPSKVVRPAKRPGWVGEPAVARQTRSAGAA